MRGIYLLDLWECSDLLTKGETVTAETILRLRSGLSPRSADTTLRRIAALARRLGHEASYEPPEPHAPAVLTISDPALVRDETRALADAKAARKRNLQLARRRRRLTRAGRCVRCTKRRDLRGYLQCAPCRQWVAAGKAKVYARWKAEGVCTNCGKKSCPCALLFSAKHVALTKQRREQGVCTVCGGERDLPRRIRCSSCAAKQHQHQNKTIVDRRARGLCVSCGVAAGGFSRCVQCRAKYRAAIRARRAEYRAAGRCLDCGGKRREGLLRCGRCVDGRRRCKARGARREKAASTARFVPFLMTMMPAPGLCSGDVPYLIGRTA